MERGFFYIVFICFVVIVGFLLLILFNCIWSRVCLEEYLIMIRIIFIQLLSPSSL